MDHMELVEKLRGKAGVGYEDAKSALEEANWDLLDAMVILERKGKVNPITTTYSTEQEPPKEEYTEPQRSKGIGEMAGKFFKWAGEIIKKGNQNNFDVEKDGKNVLSIPVTLFVVLLIVFPILPFTLLLLVVGLFCGYKYSFSGPDLGRDDVNNVIGKVSNVADNIKEEFKSATDKSATDNSTGDK